MQRTFWMVTLIAIPPLGSGTATATPARADPRDFVLVNGSERLIYGGDLCATATVTFS